MNVTHIVIDGVDVQTTTLPADDGPFGNLTDGTAPVSLGA